MLALSPLAETSCITAAALTKHDRDTVEMTCGGSSQSIRLSDGMVRMVSWKQRLTCLVRGDRRPGVPSRTAQPHRMCAVVTVSAGESQYGIVKRGKSAYLVM